MTIITALRIRQVYILLFPHKDATVHQRYLSPHIIYTPWKYNHIQPLSYTTPHWSLPLPVVSPLLSSLASQHTSFTVQIKTTHAINIWAVRLRCVSSTLGTEWLVSKSLYRETQWRTVASHVRHWQACWTPNCRKSRDFLCAVANMPRGCNACWVHGQ